MIDVSKIRVGDHLDIRMRVTRASVDGHDREFCLEYDAERRIVVNSRDHGNLILAHTPAPRQFKPGDRVLDNGYSGPVAWFIVHVKDGSAWIDDANGYSRIARLHNLRHADESE
jgi:hypothetical protein